jgi:hypothetical protein
VREAGGGLRCGAPNCESTPWQAIDVAKHVSNDVFTSFLNKLLKVGEQRVVQELQQQKEKELELALKQQREQLLQQEAKDSAIRRHCNHITEELLCLR